LLVSIPSAASTIDSGLGASTGALTGASTGASTALGASSVFRLPSLSLLPFKPRPWSFSPASFPANTSSSPSKISVLSPILGFVQ